MSLDAIMAQPGPSRSSSPPATVEHATSRPPSEGRSGENAEAVVTSDPQAVPVTAADANPKTSVATTLPPASPPTRHSSSPPSVTSAAQPSLPSSFVTAPSMSPPVATSSAVRLGAAPATPEPTSPSPSSSPSLKPALTSPSALASALGYTGPLAGYLASFTARHAGSAPATATPPRDASNGAPVDAPAASDVEPTAPTADTPGPSSQHTPSSGTEDRPAAEDVPTLPPDSGPMDEEAHLPEQAPGPPSPRAEGADALNPPLSSLNPTPDPPTSPATATQVISTTMATSTVLATSGPEQVTTTLVEKTLVVTTEAGVAPDAPSSPPTGDTTESVSPHALEGSPPAGPPQAALAAAPAQEEPTPVSSPASPQAPAERPLANLPASPAPEGTGSSPASQVVTPAPSAAPATPSAATLDATPVTTGPPVASEAASAPTEPAPTAPAFAGLAAASPAPVEPTAATATASGPASPASMVPATAALAASSAPAGPSSAAQMGSLVPAEPSSTPQVTPPALAGPSSPVKPTSSAPLARHSPTPSRASAPGAEGAFTTPPQDHERALQPSASPAREVIVLSPTRSSLTATEAAAALSRPARPAAFGAGPSTQGTEPRTPGMDVDVVVVDYGYEDEDAKPGVTLQRPEPVNRAYVSLRISRERRDELIARGVYDPIRDDDEYRPQPKRKPLASKWFARRAIAVGSDRMRVRSPEEVKDRFIRRAGPAALEPFASALDKDRLLNTLGEYPCGWKGCDSVLASEKLLEKHIKVRAHALEGRIDMADENKLFYRCLWHGCDRPCFEGMQQLLQHISAQHVSNRLLCPFDDCNLHSHTVSHLQRHAERNHDETGGPRPRVDRPWRPPLPTLPPLPGVMRTDALITYPALGTSYKSAGKQEWARARVRRGCFAGADPEIHIVHPPHMLQPLEGSTAEGTPAVGTAEGTPALGNGAENALASGSTAAVNGTDAPAVGPSQLRRKKRKNRAWGGSGRKAARQAQPAGSRFATTLNAFDAVDNEPILIPDSDDDTDPLAAAMDANTDASRTESPAGTDIIPLNAGGHPFQSGLHMRSIKPLPKKRRVPKPPTTGPTRTSTRTTGKGKGKGRARIDCVEIPVRQPWKAGSIRGPPPVAPGKGKGKERTMRGVAIVDI